MKSLFRCLLVICLFLPAGVLAQPELDTSFNSSGKMYFPGLYALTREMIVQRARASRPIRPDAN